MIDFIKFKLLNSDIRKFEDNSLLEFKALVSTETGEVSRFKQAYYKSLKFTIIQPFGDVKDTSVITVEGSLHKFWNNGEHNFNDFGEKGILKVLQELEEKFSITPDNCILRQIELGLNINPPPLYSTKTIIDSCFLHKTTSFKSIYVRDEGEYIQARHQQYIVKIYNKRKHYARKGYEINKEIMRFELKITRMRYLNNYGIQTLWDLMNIFDFAQCLYLVRKEWNNVLFYDFEAFKNNKNESLYCNPNFWGSLKYSDLKYHRNNLKNIVNKSPVNIKKNIDELFIEKFRNLFHDMDVIINIS